MFRPDRRADGLIGLRALITGGSSGIGTATARALAVRSVRVAIAGRNIAALRQVAAGTKGVFIQGDLREPGCPRRTVDLAADALGGLDLVVSNAGIGWAGPFASMTEADLDSLLDVNLRAAAHLARAAIPHLRPGSAGSSSSGRSPGWSGCPARCGTRRPRQASGAWRTRCGQSCDLRGSG